MKRLSKNSAIFLPNQKLSTTIYIDTKVDKIEKIEFWLLVQIQLKPHKGDTDEMSKFLEFLHNLEHQSFETNTTATGSVTIQQTPRNQIRKEGVAALLADLQD